MKRIAIKLIAFLLAGAIVNVAVAWGCVIRASPRLSVEQADRIEAESLIRTFDPAFILLPFDKAYIVRQFGTLQVWFESYDESSYEPSQDMIYARFAGWPLTAVCGYCRFNRDGFEYVSALTVPRALRRRNVHSMMGHDLPYRPLWPGFAINTIFYAAIWWLLFAAPFKLRRWRRFKRGLCPACAYPVGASEVCTECGKPVWVARC